MDGFSVGECPRISPFLKNNGPRPLRGLGSIIFKEWRVTGHSPIQPAISRMLNGTGCQLYDSYDNY